MTTPSDRPVPVVLAAGAEPVAGYCLVSRLGRGKFGEVWEAVAPGGFHVALKFLRSDDPQSSEVELRAIQMLLQKNLHHANLLSLHGAWLVPGYHVLAMELAEGTLQDRFHACTAQGLPGIPREELLEYLREAAKGIDYLNGVAVQHRDVKPHNLLLAGGSVKVGDFGLAKVLERSSTRNSGAMTPAYAAPECFQGRTSDRSDQYSLAVSYCQLRGGRLPFDGDLQQVMYGHLCQEPNLSTLPPAEQPAVARALAKEPDQRWPSCRAFAEAVAACPAAAEEADRPRAPATLTPPTRDGWKQPAADPHRPAAWQQQDALGPTRPTAKRPVAGRSRAWWGLVLGVMLVLLGGAYLLFHVPGEPAPEAPSREHAHAGDDGGLQASADPPAEGPPSPAKGGNPVKLPPEKTTAPRTGAGPARDGPGIPGQVEVKKNDRAAKAEPSKEIPPTKPAQAEPPPGPAREFTNSIGMKLVLIPAGSFLMGSPRGEKGRDDDEGPQREVTIPHAFYLGKFEVTRGQFQAFVKDAGYKTEPEEDGQGGCGFDAGTGKLEDRKPKYSWKYTGFAQTGDHPVLNVTWNDARSFCRWLSHKEGKAYDLPAEAEWEYACRAGTTTAYASGDDPETVVEVGNVADSSARQLFASGTTTVAADGYVFTAPAGTFRANRFGLYDMHGNVWEWCADWYSTQDHQRKDRRVRRGGSWHANPRYCRAAYRAKNVPSYRHDDVGFRVCLRPN